MKKSEYLDYLEYAVTEREEEILKALAEYGFRGAKRKLKADIGRPLKRIRERAASQGYSPEHDMNVKVPKPFNLRGTSTLYDESGKPKLQWVKTTRDQLMASEVFKETLEAMKEDIPVIKVPKHKKKIESTDIIPWFNIGDAHIGALAHASEIGTNNDIKITVSELLTAMKALIDSCPNYERCVINDLGDMTHYQDFKAESESGHKFDFDTRYPKMIRAYVEVMRSLVYYALEKFKYVDVIINQGNHSRSNDIFMRELLLACFSNCSRLNVLDNSNVFIPYRMGNTFVMTHHGDKAKHSVLSGVMATDYAKDWGESKYRYIWTGHIHHREVLAKEQAGVIIESWNTMSRGDAYSHQGGWRSRRCLSVVELSKTYGEVGRRTVPIEMVEDIIRKSRPEDMAKTIDNVYRV